MSRRYARAVSDTDVTVIVATYERPAWLEGALRSIEQSADVARQDGVRTRVIVVDDASPTDATRRVCESLRMEYMRVAEKGAGRDPAAPRALGLERVESEFFCFFDDDDEMLPEHLSRHVALLRNGADVAVSSYWSTDRELRPYRRHVPMRPTLGLLLAGHNPVNDHALQRTATCRSVWDPANGEAAPFAAWLELLYRGAGFERVMDPTFLYRRHRGNMSVTRNPEFAVSLMSLRARYREQVRLRDGRVPGPPWAYRAREAVAAPARAAVRALRR